MRVVLINGSPNPDGNTAIALEEAAEALRESGIQTDRIEIGRDALHGCAACGLCRQHQNRRCAFDDDMVNRHLETLFAADGLLVGSPVYYAGINGALKCFLDRAFFVAGANGGLFRHKAGAGVVAVRRGGEITAWDQLNKYFAISEMFIPAGNYWNMIFGQKPGEAKQDPEGLQTMRVLGANMAWLLKSLAAGAAPPPPAAAKIMTNFVRPVPPI